MALASWVVGLDVGGTKTRVCILDAECRLLGEGVGGPGNANFVSDEVARASIRQAAATALAGADSASCKTLLAVAGGPTSATHAEPALRAILGEIDVFAAGEGPITLAAGTRADHGVVVAAGTGSLAWGRNRQGDTHFTSGWGALLGDEGSAYDVAIRGLRAACRRADGRGRETALLARYLDHFHYASLREIVPPIYRGGLDRREIAATCPLVFEVARAGDSVARGILRLAGRELALAAITCARALAMDGEPFDVVCSGGVFRGGDFVLPSFRRHLARACPAAQPVLPAYEPAVGAALLGLRRLGVALDAAAYLRLDASLVRPAAGPNTAC